MKKHIRLLAAVGALVALVPLSLHAAGLFNGYPVGNGAAYCAGSSTAGVPGTASTCNNNVPAGPVLTGNEYVPADTAIPGASTGAATPTILIPSSALAGMTGGTPRNFLGNSDLLGTQVNGTSTVTGATTSAPTITAIAADRWVLDTNVGSGVGRSAIVTSSPSPPAGFTNVMKVWRLSGSLTQPVCVWQAIPSPQATQLAGQTVTFSVYAAALAGLAADNGNTINMVVVSGTGTDQGLNGSWTASPAITQAWTGIATAVNATKSVSTTFGRVYTTAAIPATATEVGVALCFTPVNGSGSATDGFAFTGAQLERGSVPSLYEVQPRQAEIADNEKFVWSISEGSGVTLRGTCFVTTANTTFSCPITFPVPMYKAPTMAFTDGFSVSTTTAQSALTACSGLSVTVSQGASVPTTQGFVTNCTSGGTTMAVGLTSGFWDDSGSGKITAWTGL